LRYAGVLLFQRRAESCAGLSMFIFSALHIHHLTFLNFGVWSLNSTLNVCMDISWYEVTYTVMSELSKDCIWEEPCIICFDTFGIVQDSIYYGSTKKVWSGHNHTRPMRYLLTQHLSLHAFTLNRSLHIFTSFLY